MRIRTIKGFAGDRRGAAAIVMALLMPILIGALAFGAEAGYWEFSRRHLQDAADVSAHAAATQLRSGVKSNSALKAVAKPVAERGGYHLGEAGITVATPPTSGAYAGNASAVQVFLDNAIPRRFTGIFTQTPVAFTVSAVALVSNGRPACILALNPTASATIAAGGSSDVTLTGCDLAANSTSPTSVLTTGGAVNIVTGCVSTVGGVYDSHDTITYTDCPGPIEYGPVTPDPYAGVPEPSVTGCQNGNNFTNAGNPSTPAPGCYNNVGNINRDIVLSPGVYILNNSDVKLTGGRTITGTGVTIFLAGTSTMEVSGNSTINITAPTSGIYSGLAIFGDRDSAGELDLTGNSGVSIVGAVYSPNSDITFTGNNASFAAGQCTQVIGSTVTFWGSSDFDTVCSASGTKEVRTAQTIRIVE
ncbi:MAG: pilus assembly protein TadG-related protein [Amphiplicatus sp.]